MPRVKHHAAASPCRDCVVRAVDQAGTAANKTVIPIDYTIWDFVFPASAQRPWLDGKDTLRAPWSLLCRRLCTSSGSIL